MAKIQTLKLTGSPFDFGYRHGQTYSEAIHHFTEERIKLSSDVHWTGHNLPREEIMEIAEACLAEHEAYSPQLVEELRGMADATGLGLAELIIMNGFTDFVDVVYTAGERTLAMPRPIDNCTAFLVPNTATADQHGFCGQTWDMHASATPYVLLIDGEPDDGIPFLSFSTTGCVGMIGMNAEGIAVGINNIMGGDGQIGVTWPFIIRKVLAQSNIDDALDCVVSAKRAGAHNYLLFDKNGRGYNIEAMGTHCEIEELAENVIVHTNHCVVDGAIALERERPADSMAHSVHRLELGYERLAERPITEETLMAVTRDESAICVRETPPLNVETCGAAIMRPATGDFWAVWGLPSENEYDHFTV
jgi:isopenicillin-N N-acyltransferase-like protein